MSRKFIWTAHKLGVLELLSRGHTQIAVANKLGVHRNNIRRWLGNDEFATRLRDETLQHTTAVKYARLRAVTAFTDRIELEAIRALQEAAARPTCLVRAKRAAACLSEYRKQRRAERIEFGEPATLKQMARRR